MNIRCRPIVALVASSTNHPGAGGGWGFYNLVSFDAAWGVILNLLNLYPAIIYIPMLKSWSRGKLISRELILWEVDLVGVDFRESWPNSSMQSTQSGKLGTMTLVVMYIGSVAAPSVVFWQFLSSLPKAHHSIETETKRLINLEIDVHAMLYAIGELYGCGLVALSWNWNMWPDFSKGPNFAQKH